MPVGRGGWQYQRIGLPAGGGIGDQDARLMAMIDIIHGTHTAMLAKTLAPRKGGEGASLPPGRSIAPDDPNQRRRSG